MLEHPGSAVVRPPRSSAGSSTSRRGDPAGRSRTRRPSHGQCAGRRRGTPLPRPRLPRLPPERAPPARSSPSTTAPPAAGPNDPPPHHPPPASGTRTDIPHRGTPNGDGQEDEGYVYCCLAKTVDVTVTVKDSTGALVRTVESGVEHPGSPGCNGWNICTTWDGKDDAGKTVADGVYSVTVAAKDSADRTASGSIDLGVDTRTPGRLTAPAAGDTLAGLARFT